LHPDNGTCCACPSYHHWAAWIHVAHGICHACAPANLTLTPTWIPQQHGSTGKHGSVLRMHPSQLNLTPPMDATTSWKPVDQLFVHHWTQCAWTQQLMDVLTNKFNMTWLMATYPLDHTSQTKHLWTKHT